MALGTQTRQIGTVTVVAFQGKITLGEASQQVRDTVDRLLAQGQVNVLLNLKDVPFIDSAGLGALTLSYTKAKSAGGMLKLAELQPRVKDALEVTRLTRIFHPYESESEASASFALATASGNEQPGR